MIVSGQNPFPHLNMETPSIFTWAISNKIYACLMVFFISNAVEGQMISTGAFEVSFNDVPIWSKLQTGRIPAPGEMFQIIENQMNLNPNQPTQNM
ncbi:Selenoprotein T1b [Mizuhopecten yessoensis]|uniref:Selenoprotein T1b n=2 Tax=Mizuhopecten yessoensis TaxID=6573 RepID=A0A210PYL8_MIZYE|nr:Selenoprotein T1b [Mizuhopecten yessoensis]